jgi:hypothetical protein
MFGLLNDSSAQKATNTAPVEEETKTGETTEVETESEAVENTEDTTSEDTTEDNDSENSGDTDTELDKKPKKGFERRIEKFNQKLSDKDKEIEYWRRAALGGNQSEAKPVVPNVPADKPLFSQFNDIETYAEALTDWKVAKALGEVTQKQQVANVVSSYDQRVQEFKKTTPDFQEVLDEFVEDYGDRAVPEVVQVCMDSEVGPKIAYYLAKNTSEVDRIAALPPHRRLLELGKIEDRLSTKTETKTAKVDKVSQAPKPIETVKGGGKVDTKSIYDDDLPYEQWVKVRVKKK